MAERIGTVLRFGGVGLVGFAVDSGVLYAGLGLGLDPYSGRLVSYLVAATVTWFLHRRVTFRVTCPARLMEWLQFLAANAAGGLLNLGLYGLLLLHGELFRHHPVLAVGIGALAGLSVNYLVSARLIFRARESG